MNPNESPAGGRAAELRREFDASFAAAPAEHRGATEDLLALSAGGSPCAVRLSEVSGLHAGCPVTSLPCPVPGLLGIAGIGGSLVPVYDLGVLLGGTASGRSRWMLVAAGSVVALAFDVLEGHLRVPREAVGSADRADPRRAHSREVLRTEGRLRPILQLSSVVREIEVGDRRGASRKEG